MRFSALSPLAILSGAAKGPGRTWWDQLQARSSAFRSLGLALESSLSRVLTCTGPRPPGSISGLNHLVPHPSHVICGAWPSQCPTQRYDFKEGFNSLIFLSQVCLARHWGRASESSPSFAFRRMKCSGLIFRHLPVAPFPNFCLPPLGPQLFKKSLITHCLSGLRH